LEQLIRNIKTYSPLSNDAEQVLYSCFEKLLLPKNEFLITEGKICRHLYFLEQGAIRGYYLLDGKEITHWFAFENDFVTSSNSFITGQPAVENIQLLEGSVLWSISKLYPS